MYIYLFVMTDISCIFSWLLWQEWLQWQEDLAVFTDQTQTAPRQCLPHWETNSTSMTRMNSEETLSRWLISHSFQLMVSLKLTQLKLNIIMFYVTQVLMVRFCRVNRFLWKYRDLSSDSCFSFFPIKLYCFWKVIDFKMWKMEKS